MFDIQGHPDAVGADYNAVQHAVETGDPNNPASNVGEFVESGAGQYIDTSGVGGNPTIQTAGDMVFPQTEPVFSQEDPFGRGDELVREAQQRHAQEPAPNVDYVAEAAKFQSLYDRSQSELQRAQEAISLINSDPQLVELIQRKARGEDIEPDYQPQMSSDEVNVPEGDFDPWAAYYDPNSESYKMRVKDMESKINQGIEQALNQKFAEVERNNALSELRRDIATNYGMQDPKQQAEFIDFVTTDKAQLPLGVLVEVFNKLNNKTEDRRTNLQVVQENQQLLHRPAAPVQGGNKRPVDAFDAAWDRIVNNAGPIKY